MQHDVAVFVRWYSFETRDAVMCLALLHCTSSLVKEEAGAKAM